MNCRWKCFFFANYFLLDFRPTQMSSAIFVKSHPMFIQVQFYRWVQPSTSTSSNYWPSSTVWRLCQGNCVKRPQKYNSAKISLIHLYVQNREWILRLDEVIATLKDSTESPSSAIWGWRFQSTMVRGKIVHFSVNRQRNTSSVGDMLQHLKWCSLEDQRRDARLVMMYKIFYDKVTVRKSEDFHCPWDSPETCTLSHIRSHYVGLNREMHNFPSHHCRLEPPSSDRRAGWLSRVLQGCDYRHQH
jgi:hypothetical protein